MTKRLKLDHVVFIAKYRHVSTFSIISLTYKFEGIPSIGGSNYGGVVLDILLLAVHLRNDAR